ncbi:hypothetical protein [Cupriavidus numazuensis]|uniref:Uncharacterized protein n=1 Tax=Cupriavidus numazuensis TaxID=221992 RepID=A0ABM8TD31_9BURK|nr:hypothetical protein [Cupriavidus numazuensis]CAG2136172.1 hypothetical protein LMG26411_01206 [Cupriavidus numazuensis]
MIKKTKQAWEKGQVVNVGFIKGLTVIAAVAAPGDRAPDSYVLLRGEQFYAFVPHRGISKIGADEARRMIAEGQRLQAAAEARAARQAAGAIAAAKLAAELMTA